MARSKKIPRTPKSTSGSNQGEGDRDSARRFNDAERAFVDSERGRAAIRTGSKARDPEEEDDLRDAEADDQLRKAPVYERDELSDNDTVWRGKVFDYYKQPPYWG